MPPVITIEQTPKRAKIVCAACGYSIITTKAKAEAFVIRHSTQPIHLKNIGRS